MGTLPVLESFGEPEIGELQVTFAVEEYVLGFQVAVDDRQSVQIVEGGDNLRGVEQTRSVGELTGVAQVCEELAAAKVFEQHVQISPIMVGPYPATKNINSRLYSCFE